ncbi:hypothetical protein RCL1_004202 [Eukaryota sp. TZLM3-RCL]
MSSVDNSSVIRLSTQTDPRSGFCNALYRMYYCLAKSNFWSVLLFVIECLQIVGFVTRSVYLHPLFDLNPILYAVSLPFYDAESWLLKYRLSALITVVVLLIIGISFLSVLYFFKNKNATIPIGLYRFSRLFFEVVTSVLYIPGMSLILTGLNCSTDPIGSPAFVTLLSSDCGTTKSYIITLLSIIFASLFLLISLIFLSCYDSSFTSKRVFARTHHQSHFIMLLVKTFVLVMFFFFHARFWLFRSVYLLGALLATAAFYYRPPFLSLNSNLLVVGLLGMWSGNGVAFFLYSAFNLRGWNSVVVNTFMFYILMVAGAFGVTFLTFKRFQKHLDLVSSINSTLVVNKFVDEMGKLNIDADIDSIRLSDYDFSITSPYQIDLMTRAVFPKPLSSNLRSTLRIILSYGDFLFPDSLFMKILRLNFELSVTNDPITCASIISVIKKMDIELSFAQEYRLFCLDRQLESLRRAQSTGHNLDSSSFREFQVKQKEFNHLHKECLESLFFFWNSLAAQSVDLSTLPVLLNRVQEGKQKAEGLFNQLIQLQGDHSSVLLSYANFLREVDCDNEKSAFLEEQAGLLSASDRSSHSESSSISGSIALSAKGLARKQKKRRLGSAVINNLSTGQKSQSKSAIKTLKSSVVIAIIIMFALSFISWFLSTVILDTARRNVDVLYEASHVQHVGQLLKSKAFEAMLFYENFGLTEKVKDLARLISKEAEHSTLHLRRLVVATEEVLNTAVCPRAGDRAVQPPSPEFQNLLLTNRFSLFNFQNINPGRERASVQSFWSINLYHAFLSSSLSKSLLADSDFIIATAKGGLSALTSFEGTSRWLYDYIQTSFAEFLNLVYVGQVFFTIMILSIVLFIGIFLFARSFNNIVEERRSILNLFLYIPKREIAKMLASDKFNFVRSSRRVSHNQREQFDMSEDPHSQSEEDFIHSSTPFRSKFAEQVEERLGDQLVVEVPQFDEPTTSVQKLSVPPVIKFILVILCTLMISFLIMILFSFQAVDNGVQAVNNHFDTAFSSRSNVASVTTVERRLSSFIQLYSYIGDGHFLSKFSQILNVDLRNQLMRRVLDVGLSEPELRSLGNAQTIVRNLRYRERIALTLLLSVFDLPNDVLPIPTPLDYNVYDETDVYLDFLKFPEYTNWYTNATFDLSRSPEERLVVAREILSNRRFYELFQSLMRVMEGTGQEILVRRSGILRDEVSDIFTNLEYQVALSGVTLIIFLIFIVFILRYSKRLRFGAIFIGFLIVLCLLVFVGVGYLFYETSFAVRIIENTSIEGIELATYAIQGEVFFWEFIRDSQRLAFNLNDQRLIPMLEAYHRFTERLNEMKDASRCLDDELSQVCKSTANIATSISKMIADVAPRYLIAAKLKLAALGLTHLPEFSELDVTWDIPSLSFREQSKWVLPNNLQLTNEADDLALSSEELHELAMAVVSSRDFADFTDKIVDEFNELRSWTMTEIGDILADLVSKERDQIFYSNIAVIVLILFLVIMTIIFYLASIPKKIKHTHIKQRVPIPEIQTYTKQYIVSLTILFLVLLFFFFVSFITISKVEDFPQLLSMAGERTALVSSITADILQHYSIASNYDRFLHFAYQKSDQLILLNRILTNEQLKTSSQQSMLLFHSNYDDYSRDFGNSTGEFHGLHALLLHFALDVHRMSLREDDISIGSPLFTDVIENSVPLISACLDSIDYYYNYAVGVIRYYSIMLLSVFIAFVVLLGLVFVFVFWRMLKQLQKAETITLEFLDMIDDEIVAQVDVIRNYLRDYNR